MITLIALLGNYWAKHYFHFSEAQIYEYGLVGIFLARIFGAGWLTMK